MVHESSNLSCPTVRQHALICYTYNMRTCKKCNVEYPIEEFAEFSRGEKTYRMHSCRECERKRKRVDNPKTKKLYFDGQNKECSMCGEIKAVDLFSRKNNQFRSVCKECHNSYYREYYSKKDNGNFHKKRVARRREQLGPIGARAERHGLTKEELLEIIEKNNGKCYICNERDWSVIDHDHSCCKKTGCKKCVRAVLCNQCNVMLGQANDSIDRLHSAIEYLTEYGLRYKGV